MAKMSKKKSARRVHARRPAKKAARKPKPRGGSSSVRPVSTGRGPGPAELGAGLVAAFNKGEGDAWVKSRWSDDIHSVEGEGVGTEWIGRQAVQAKNGEWGRQNTVLGASAEGPYVGSTGFAVKFRSHVRENASGAERHLEEIGVFTVKDGKIVREEFMFGS